MLGKAVISVLGAAIFAGVAHAATPIRGQTLMPGVVYSRQVEFTAHGPVVLHVLAAPKPTGLYALKPVLSNNAVVGRERVTAMQRRLSAEATTASVNGGTGGLLRAGVLDKTPLAARSMVGVGADGVVHVDRVHLEGSWQGTGQRRLLSVNDAPRPNRATLYTPAYGPRTPAESGGAYAILQPFPAAQPNTALTTTVVGYADGGNQPIPPDGAVLVARGQQAGFLSAEAPVGTKLTVALLLTPAWPNVPDAIGGGPQIVRDGRPVFRSFEDFTPQQLMRRQPRAGVGQLADGRVVMVAVDGRQPGYSTGLTNFELALTMMRLGCVTASALDSGPETTMAFDAKLLNRPARAEPAVNEALTLFYYGVFAPLLPARVLSPNGDGADDTQTLAYKVVRPSDVTATLTGPSGAVVPLDSGARAPGVYRFDWNGRGEQEGSWTFRVVADDDLGRRSTADRQFSLNNTLGFLSAQTAGRQATARFKLARAARVVVRVETPAGAIVRTLPTRALPAGDASASWRGAPGRYVFSVTATNDGGSVELTAPFRLGR